MLYKCNCRVGEPATIAAALVGVEAPAGKSHESVESSLQRSLGRGVTPAKRLDVLGFSYRVLVEIQQSTATSDNFQRVFLIQICLQQAAAREADPALSKLSIRRVGTLFLPAFLKAQTGPKDFHIRSR